MVRAGSSEMLRYAKRVTSRRFEGTLPSKRRDFLLLLHCLWSFYPVISELLTLYLLSKRIKDHPVTGHEWRRGGVEV
jgi:hypothetical protein